jgi:aspartate racemase
MNPALGILGGMGPLATVDFMQKVIERTPAATDQDHIPMIVASIPQVPDRTAAILGRGESPVPAMLEGIHLLNRAGVDLIAIPCNTAHYWFDDLVGESRAPILHIADAACTVLEQRARGVHTVGFMGTSGAVAAGIYQQRVIARGYDCLVPPEDEQETLVMGGIYKIKAGDLTTARQLLERAADGLRARGAGAIILGCTEIPIVIKDGGDVVDATLALAEACVERFAVKAGTGA